MQRWDWLRSLHFKILAKRESYMYLKMGTNFKYICSSKCYCAAYKKIRKLILEYWVSQKKVRISENFGVRLTYFLLFTVFIFRNSAKNEYILENSICPPEHEKTENIFHFGFLDLNYRQCIKSGGCFGEDKRCYLKEAIYSKTCKNKRCTDWYLGSNNTLSNVICSTNPNTFFHQHQISKKNCLAISGCPMKGERCALPVPLRHSSRKSIKISVIVPCFDQHQYLESAMVSIFQQSYKNFELLIVDDGSSKKKCARKANNIKKTILPRFGEIKFSQVSVFYKQNSGLADTRNFGASHSNGEYLCFLDADDLLTPNYFLSVVEKLTKYPKRAVIFGDQVLFDETRSTIWTLFPITTLEMAMMRSPLPVMTIVSRDLFNRVGGYSLDMIYGLEDYDFWLTVIRFLDERKESYKILKLNGPQSWYRMKPVSMSRSLNFQKFAFPMFYLKHNSLYQNKCENLAILFCNSNEGTVADLERNIWQNEGTCLSYIWLALLKTKLSCRYESSVLLSRALRTCKLLRPNENFTDILHSVYVVTKMDDIENVLSSDPKVCARRFVRICHKTNRKVSALQVLQKVNDNYFPYYSRKNDDILSSFPHIRSIVNRYTNSLSKKMPNRRTFPKIFHFIYGLSSPALEFKFYHYLSIASAIMHNSPTKVILHYQYLPVGKWWNKIKEHVTLQKWEKSKIKCRRCFSSYAHFSDYIRLMALYQHGGVYMDLDIISFRPLNLSMGAEFVAAWQDSSTSGTQRQGAKHYGLCNAVMISHPNSTFIAMWVELYAYFRSTGHDNNWDEHSVRLPAQILEYEDVFISRRFVAPVSSKTFWSIMWSETELFFQKERLCDMKCFRSKYKSAVVFHLWSSSADDVYKSRLESLSFENNVVSESLLDAISKEVYTKFYKKGWKSRFPFLSTPITILKVVNQIRALTDHNDVSQSKS